MKKVMKMIKRKIRIKLNFLLSILVVCFLVSASLSYSSELPTEMKKYTFEFYGKHFNEILFPKIENHLKQYRIFNEEDSQKIAEEVLKIVIEDCQKEKIVLFRPPTIKVMKIGNDQVVTYTLEINLVVFDGKESNGIFLTSMSFGKKFLIFFKNLKQVEI